MTDGMAPIVSKRRLRSALGRYLPALKLSYVLAIVGFVIVAAGTILAAFFISSLRDSELKAIRNRLEIPAQAVAQIAKSISRVTNLALQDIQEAAEAQDGRVTTLPSLHKMLVERDHLSELIRAITIYDLTGKPIVTSFPGLSSKGSVADYSFFKQQIASRRNVMMISELIADPLDGRPTAVASRPLFDRAGNTRGVIAVYFDTAQIQESLDSLQMPSGTTLTLFNLEGRQIVRTPAIKLGDRALGIDFSTQPPFRNFLDHKPGSTFIEFTNVSGQRRFYAHAGGIDTGFVVVAAWDADVALAPWQHAAMIVGGGTFAAALVIIGLFLSAMREISRGQVRDFALRQSREDLARAQRIAGIGSFSRNLLTGHVEWSEEFLRIWGLKEGMRDLTAEFLAQLVHPEDRTKFLSVRDIPLTERTGLSLDFRITRPDGEERILHREYGIIRDEHRRPLRSFGIVQDITERKRAEIDLRRSRANMAQAQKIAVIGSFERDLVTGETEWSDEMYCILGQEKDKVTPSYEALVKLVHPEDRELFAAARDASMKGTPTGTLEFRIIRPDGVERRIRRETGTVFDEEMRPIRFYGSYQDITERRLAEARERELERQLLHSQKLEALGTLAGGIAHDLNNTLVPIMALSKVTARRLEPGSVLRANLETIFEASERARDLVKRVVSFSRRDPLERRNTDIAATVNEALKLLRATIPSSICLETRITAVPLIAADGSQIHQVVTNLLSNAAQAIGAEIGKITVTLDLVSNASGQTDIRLAVSDTGVGMDEMTQQRIFEPFFTTKTVGQGTGLGLSIVHGIVTGHGGRIEVESAPGKGTRFELYFPVLAAESTTDIARPAA